jgi:hypothetical protein
MLMRFTLYLLVGGIITAFAAYGGDTPKAVTASSVTALRDRSDLTPPMIDDALPSCPVGTHDCGDYCERNGRVCR